MPNRMLSLSLLAAACTSAVVPDVVDTEVPAVETAETAETAGTETAEPDGVALLSRAYSKVECLQRTRGMRPAIAELGELQPADENGMRLPPGFTSRVLATSGQALTLSNPTRDSDYLWHDSPDGSAVIELDDGWAYVSNSEVDEGLGGVGVMRFDPSGALVDAYSVASGTDMNCSGGATPWGTWLSAEEIDLGGVDEADPLGNEPVRRYRSMGVFKHEAIEVDPITFHVYMSEHQREGLFYRFTPSSRDEHRADLSSGVLEVAILDNEGGVTWATVPDPEFVSEGPTRFQVPGAAIFPGSEGMAWWDRYVYVMTTGGGNIWEFDVVNDRARIMHTAAELNDDGVSDYDNLTSMCDGTILVTRDSDPLELIAVYRDGSSRLVLQVEGQLEHGGLTGAAFDPTGTRMYVSSMTGVDGAGITFEVTGPFHVPE